MDWVVCVCLMHHMVQDVCKWLKPLGRTTSLTLMIALCKAATAKASPPSTNHISLASAKATTPWAEWKAAATQTVAVTGQATAAASTP